MNVTTIDYELVIIHSAMPFDDPLIEHLKDGYEVVRADATATSVHYLLRKEAELLPPHTAASNDAAANENTTNNDDKKPDDIDDKPIDLSEIPF